MIRDNIKLSNRLMMSVRMVTTGNTVADIGCDHAHTCIYLIKEGISPRAIAMDVRKGPLAHADANIKLYGYEKKISIRLSDGLASLEAGETDSIIITGMGGTLTVQILENGIEKAAAAKELILQPQSDIGMVRCFLRKNGFVIVDEDMCIESGKFYNSIKAVQACGNKKREDNQLIEVYDEFGEKLLKEHHPICRQYLQVMMKKTERVIKKIMDEGSEGSTDKKEFFENYLVLTKKAMGFF
ncbi:MAG: SAM-dependent methyltransferase [Lachnospiraceae bacterium]|nr:SAM-dependent methyltransferase [Lachnospiraceae bacterium]